MTAFTLALTGCGADPGNPGAAGVRTASTASASTPSDHQGTSTLTVTDAWAKQASAGGMTAVFAVLHNPTTGPVTITSASSPAAGATELHETVKDAAGQMTMRPAAGGITIAPGGTTRLEPGASHLMLLDLVADLDNGSVVTLTLTTSTGELVVEAPVRAFRGAEESYQPSPGHS